MPCGNSEGMLFGDSEEILSGNSEEMPCGNSEEMIFGNSEEIRVRETAERTGTDVEKLLGAIRELFPEDAGRVTLMEVCGTHTMAIGRSGIRQLLPPQVRLLSGPGCPVCVTPAGRIDQMLRLSEEPGVILAVYGDMIRVPGSRRGDTLFARRAGGAKITIVYSAMDALDLAEKNPDKEIVFPAVGFETTAPGTAAAVRAAADRRIGNFTILPLLKKVEPALRALLQAPDFGVQGFLCPGHVATIIGESGFRFLPEEYSVPAVISGFEPEDILVSVWRLLRQIRSGKAVLENEYTRAVAPEGNPLAMQMMQEVFCTKDERWRGLGMVPEGGMTLREAYSAFNAEDRFSSILREVSAEGEETAGCRCGEILQGRAEPRDCPLFGRACTPEMPAGPCMVSSEGTCAAAWKYDI